MWVQHKFSRRWLAFVGVSLILISACGGSDSTSNRRLNSVLCFETLDQRDAAIAEAERALTDLTPPVIENASSSGGASLAFVAPHRWWMRSSNTDISTSSTSTTVAPSRARTIGSPSNLRVRNTDTSFILQWNAPSYGGYRPERYAVLVNDGSLWNHAVTINSYEMPHSWFPAGRSVSFQIRSDNDTESLYSDWSNEVSAQVPGAASTTTVVEPTDSTVLSTDTTVASTDTSVPLIDDVVTEELKNALIAAQNAPLCDDVEGVELSNDPDPEQAKGSAICTGTLRNATLSFDCENQFRVRFAYITTQGVADGAGTSMYYGDQDTVLGPLEDIAFAYLFFDGPNGNFGRQCLVNSDRSGCGDALVGDFSSGKATFTFSVPASDPSNDDEADDEEFTNPPYFTGGFDGVAEDYQTFTFSIPQDYSRDNFDLSMTSECDAQSIGAEIFVNGDLAATLEEIASPWLSEGMCGVWINVPVAGLSPDELYEVVVRTSTDNRVDWGSTVQLVGVNVFYEDDAEYAERDEGENEVGGIVWNEPVSQMIEAFADFSIIIPKGGRHFQAVGITNQPDDLNIEGEWVDPTLWLYDDQGRHLAFDDNGGETRGHGFLSARLNMFLPEGTYLLRASTYPMSYPNSYPGTPTKFYELWYRTESRAVVADSSTTSTTQPTDVRPNSQTTSVIVVPIDEPAVVLQPRRPVFVLPVSELKETGTKAATLPSIVVPAGVSEVVCDRDCVVTLLDTADVTDGVITIKIGDEVVEMNPAHNEVSIPVRRNARTMQVSVKPTDGGAPVVLQRDLYVISPETFSTNVSDTPGLGDTSNGVPTPAIAIVVLLGLGAAAVVIRRKKSLTTK